MGIESSDEMASFFWDSNHTRIIKKVANESNHGINDMPYLPR